MERSPPGERISRMRIISGQAAGTILTVPRGLALRPTPDRVKQAIFNSLGARVGGARVLDLFAGSGALGLESLSRGAASVLSVEQSRKHGLIIRDNLAKTGLPAEKHQLRTIDVFLFLRQLSRAGELFDLILADPPYGEKNIGRRSESPAQALLDEEHLPGLLSSGGLFVLGHARRDVLTPNAAWHEVKVLTHGDSVMRFLERAM